MKKSTEVKNILNGITVVIENTWNNKDRETYTINKLLELPWLHDGQDLFYTRNSKGKKIATKLSKKIKKCFVEYRHKDFTSEELEHDCYVIHEPFGSRSSPDYLFITPNGIFGIEDKSSKNGKILWNTGTPGQDKIITYFDKTNKIVYLITSYEYGWTKEITLEYDQHKKENRKHGKTGFKNNFNDKSPAISKMSYSTRPMLNDDNIICDLYDPAEKNVDKILTTYLDN